MPSRSRALELCRRHAGAFVRRAELRLLHVRAGADVRGEVLEILGAMEFHADARGPVVVLEDASLEPERGWPERVERLRAEHAARVDASPDLFGAFVWTDEHLERIGVARFGAAARAFSDTLPASSSTLTLVLAPTRVDDAVRWREDLDVLLTTHEWRALRWVVVDEGEGAPIAAHLEHAARSCEVDPDPFDLGALAASIQIPRDPRDPEKIVGAPYLGRFGRAGPQGVLPPDRRAPGVDPRADADPRWAHQRFIAAAAAAQGGDLLKAVELQGEACDYAQSGPPRVMVIHRMTLAGYVLAAGDRGKAADEYADAARWASGGELHGLEAQARLSRGSILESLERHPEAAAEYAAAAEGAERAEEPVLAIAAWRAAGRHAEALGNDAEAVGAYGQAMRIADTDRDAAQAADAPGIARQLAEVLRRLELGEEAAGVDELAERLSEPPVPPVPEGASSEEGDEPAAGPDGRRAHP